MESKGEHTGELNNPDLSIICNNCLGGFIYQYYNIEYRTPTLGLFIPAVHYVKFLKDIKLYLSKKLEFIKPEQSMDYESFKNRASMITFPIARLGDIEVFFMHYKDEEEASSKWYRRINKIRWDNLIVIMAENESFNYEVLKEFDKLSFKNKVCFTKEEYPEIRSACCISEMRKTGSRWSAESVMRYFDLTDFINNRK
ncbi:MAG: DUF1919 domain-containing protein [Clostridium sp.]|nr:DUF1919 domain-containing protein [Clostridium sp.]